jgi:hypothetical protein
MGPRFLVNKLAGLLIPSTYVIQFNLSILYTFSDVVILNIDVFHFLLLYRIRSIEDDSFVVSIYRNCLKRHS